MNLFKYLPVRAFLYGTLRICSYFADSFEGRTWRRATCNMTVFCDSGVNTNSLTSQRGIFLCHGLPEIAERWNILHFKIKHNSESQLNHWWDYSCVFSESQLNYWWYSSCVSGEIQLIYLWYSCCVSGESQLNYWWYSSCVSGESQLNYWWYSSCVSGGSQLNYWWYSSCVYC